MDSRLGIPAAEPPHRQRFTHQRTASPTSCGTLLRMSDIDEELKRVQLQRERLALERELSRRALRDSTRAALAGGALGVVGAVRAVFRGIGRFIRVTWKWAAVAVVVGIVAMVKDGIDRSEKIAQERAQAEAAAQARAEAQAVARQQAEAFEWAQEARRAHVAEAAARRAVTEHSKRVAEAHAAEAEAAGSTEAASAPAAERYVVEAGAYVDRVALTSVRRQIEQTGLKTYTQVVESDSGTITRVRIGPYSTSDDAQAVADKLSAGGFPVKVVPVH